MNIRSSILWALIFFVLLCLCAAVPAFSQTQTPSVQATVNTTRTTIDSPISLSVTMAGEDGKVDTSAIQDFRILSQASGSSIQIINGQVNRQRTLTYTLLPLKEGALTIPALNVIVDGKKASTKPIVVQVLKSTETTDSAIDIQVAGTVNESRPYLGQQIVYTFRLLYGVQIANTDYEPPSFEGFSAEQIGNQATDQTVLNGRRYQTVTISYLLVPLKTGKLTIEPAALQCDLVYSRRNSRSMFDSFFSNSQLVPKVFRTDPVSIEVLPLPEWKGPESFSGLVGRFNLEADLEARNAAVGESITLSVTLRGNGNLQDAEQPLYHIPDAFKQYADQPEIDVQLESKGYTGKKVFKTALVPVAAGDYILGVAPTVYFDPDETAYRRLTVTPMSVTVHESVDSSETATVFSALDAGGDVPSLQKRMVDFTGRDILSVKTGLEALSSQAAMPTAWFLGLLAAPGVVFLIIFSILGMVRKDDRPAAVMAEKSRRALKAARSAAASDHAEALSSIYRALLYAVFAKARIPGESLTQAEAEELLTQSDVDAEVTTEVSALFAQLDSARYGKTALSRDRIKALISETGRLVRGLVR